MAGRKSTTVRSALLDITRMSWTWCLWLARSLPRCTALTALPLSTSRGAGVVESPNETTAPDAPLRFRLVR